MTDSYEMMGNLMPAIKLDFSSVRTDVKGMIEAPKRAGKEALVQMVIDKLPIPNDHKVILKWFATNQYDYMAWALQDDGPAFTKASMIKYLGDKGPRIFLSSSKSFGSYSHNQAVVCASTIASVLIDLRGKTGLLKGGPIGFTAGIGLLMLDLIEVGNSCEFIQEGYYDLFLASADAKIKPIIKKRMSVQSDRPFTLAFPTLNTAHKTMMCSK